MGTANFWDIINLHRNKIIFFVLFFISFPSIAQQGTGKEKKINNPYYDNRLLSYGFLLGIHQSNYKFEYSDAFANESSPIHQLHDLSQFHSVLPRWTVGFTLGFIVNFKFFDLLDARVTPQVTFYEYHLDYKYLIVPNSGLTKLTETQIIESTLVEFPLLAKFKSERRGNTRLYVVGGLKPGIEVSGKNKIESGNEQLDVRTGNLSLEAGLGLDIYFPLFKFSPEIRYSRGITNMHRKLDTPFSASIKELNTNTITLYLLFQ